MPKCFRSFSDTRTGLGSLVRDRMPSTSLGTSQPTGGWVRGRGRGRVRGRGRGSVTISGSTQPITSHHIAAYRWVGQG